ncbi:gnat family acetyltraansferase [Leptolyngbya sp. Heron Island J]|uniref:GNAT family N-acetyltransferase n=1 Tax=Leptolyngbya sp. Heron Island J TaxID=1385935 RepID=UPI0003B9CC2A|nr:GNAT family N-acetyltransferase [Leptolyngbya sp. Heron Island J]ESA33493.1 gnat family acetyltraansferase [Leptolyngbya sp. Heron Island J]
MIRNYRESDFEYCQYLVNRVWHFDKHFYPPELAKVFSQIYVASPLALSNFIKVVDVNKKPCGFLFGRVENLPRRKSDYSGLVGQLKIMSKLFFIPGVSLKRKLSYFHKIYLHETNRRKAENEIDSEILLLVVDPDSQGKGWGKELVNTFIESCVENEVKKVVLETDAESNYGFYNHLGFSVKGDFYSPLLKEFSGKSGKTYIYELDLEQLSALSKRSNGQSFRN